MIIMPGFIWSLGSAWCCADPKGDGAVPQDKEMLVLVAPLDAAVPGVMQGQEQSLSL